MKNIKILFSPEIIATILLFSILSLENAILTTRQFIISFTGENGGLLSVAALVSLLTALPVCAFFYGRLTDLIVLKMKKEEVSFWETLKRTRFWFTRSMLIVAISWAGIISVTLLIPSIKLNSVFTVLGFLIGGLWLTFTFIFFPIVMISRKPIITAIGDSLSITLSSVNRWFYLFVILFIASGGFVYIWMPQGIAQQFTNVSVNLPEWMVHFQWTGGYSFAPFWYMDYAKSLGVSPHPVILTIFAFINSLIATGVKIKVTRILYEEGYLSSASEPVGDYFINPELEKAP